MTEENKPALTNEQKLEIGRMFLEGVSDEGINAIIDSWLKEGTAIKVTRQIMPDISYTPYTEFGFSLITPIDASKVIEGTVSKIEEDAYQAWVHYSRRPRS